jgi:hypothetical protein
MSARHNPEARHRALLRGTYNIGLRKARRAKDEADAAIDKLPQDFTIGQSCAKPVERAN